MADPVSYEAITSQVEVPEVVSMEATPSMAVVPRSRRPMKLDAKEKQKKPQTILVR